MAIFLNSAVRSLILFSLRLLSFFTYPHQDSPTTFSPAKGLPISSPKTFQDVLHEFGLPEGLLPNVVKFYNISKSGDFEVELRYSGCMSFNHVVRYANKITGKLEFGVISDVSGIKVHKPIFMVPVIRIEVGSDFDLCLLEFHVGILSETLLVGPFQSSPICKRKFYREKELGDAETVVSLMNAEAYRQPGGDIPVLKLCDHKRTVMKFFAESRNKWIDILYML